jgi:hypothetical protein
MNVVDALANAAKGTVVGGLGCVVVGLAPEVGRWLFGNAGEKTTGLSGIILVAFGGLIFVVLTQNNLSGTSMPLANVLLGLLAAMATQVANYWLGSAAKNDQIAALTADAQSLVPSDIVHRLLPEGMAGQATG